MYKGGLTQQGKKLHKSMTVKIFEQLRCLLESTL